MYRKALSDIDKWKDSTDRKPLIIRRTRQVGKTWLVREAAQKRFVYIFAVYLVCQLERLVRDQNLFQASSSAI